MIVPERESERLDPSKVIFRVLASDGAAVSHMSGLVDLALIGGTEALGL